MEKGFLCNNKFKIQVDNIVFQCLLMKRTESIFKIIGEPNLKDERSSENYKV